MIASDGGAHHLFLVCGTFLTVKARWQALNGKFVSGYNRDQRERQTHSLPRMQICFMLILSRLNSF